MQTIWTIAQREYKRYFTTPAAYMVAFMFLVILGFLFYINLQGALLNPNQPPPNINTIIAPLVFY